MSRKLIISSILGFSLLLFASSVFAQDPRPTPTNVAPPGEGGNESDDSRGSISGFVYSDVNGDGQCVNTGVAGEEPIQGVDVQFVSSDRETVITQYSGDKGDFGLYAAGQSYWEVTVMPEDGWRVTTEATVYVPVYPETLSHDNVNFCLAEGAASSSGVSGGNAIINIPLGAGTNILLPESGASAAQLKAQNNLVLLVIMVLAVGLLLVFVGYFLEHRRKTNASN
jgi:hypothetical protein